MRKSGWVTLLAAVAAAAFACSSSSSGGGGSKGDTDGGSSSGGGSGSSSGAPTGECASLAMCCPALPSTGQAGCNSLVQSGLSDECQNALTGYERLNECE